MVSEQFDSLGNNLQSATLRMATSGAASPRLPKTLLPARAGQWSLRDCPQGLDINGAYVADADTATQNRCRSELVKTGDAEVPQRRDQHGRPRPPRAVLDLQHDGSPVGQRYRVHALRAVLGDQARHPLHQRRDVAAGPTDVP